MVYTVQLEASSMRFTLTMFGGSLTLIVAAALVFGPGILSTIGVIWFLLSIPLVGYYWVTRVVRRAWRDGARRDEAPS
jgi:UPF0716 family protein affecting phage T7 exclusion